MLTDQRTGGLAPEAGSEPMVPRLFRVVQARQVTEDTTTLRMEACDGAPLAFAPGQFTMIGRPGHREVPISVSGDPSQPEVLEQTVRAVGDATAALAGATPGSGVLVRGPYGTGWEVADGAGAEVVIVAGGIGLAPVRPALLHILADRTRYGRVTLVYGGRGPEHLLFRDELERWRGRLDLDVAVTVDAAPPHWRGDVGLVTSVLPTLKDPERALALVCGPEIMMRLTADALVARGVLAPRVRLSMERNMQCAVGLCGHCMVRELFVCTDGPVFAYPRVAALLMTREL